MPQPPQSASLAYKLLLFFLSPAVLTYLVYRSIKDGGWRYITQRLGFNLKPSTQSPILFHCASVGEANAAKPLIFELIKQQPKLSFVVSTNTPTAASLINNWGHPNISHTYFPVDYNFAIKAFLTQINPRCVLILETEIWPCFFSYTAKRKIPFAIINGRLSNKTLNANNLIKEEYKRALKNLSKLLARSETDRKNYIELGASSDTTFNIGNLKFVTSKLETATLACTTIKRPFVLAASTHDDEENQLVEHLEILRNHKFMCVIAPRYPDRGHQLAKQLARSGCSIALRSDNDKINEDTDIYIVDTLGELAMYYNEAALVFVGGSLINRGGHNILEPASFGKCILVGPYTYNFEQEVIEMLNANAIIQVKNNYELGVEFVSLLKDAHRRELYGLNARKFIENKNLIINDYIEHLKPLLSK